MIGIDVTDCAFYTAMMLLSQSTALQVVMSDAFDAFIMLMILMNVACLAITHVDMVLWLHDTLFWLNVIFTTVFCVEAIAKITALGPVSYFMDRWCIFDCLVAALSVVQIAIDVWTTSDVPAINLLRVFRVTRIFRLIPKVCNHANLAEHALREAAFGAVSISKRIQDCPATRHSLIVPKVMRSGGRLQSASLSDGQKPVRPWKSELSLSAREHALQAGLSLLAELAYLGAFCACMV